jgi:hypothetical protein
MPTAYWSFIGGYVLGLCVMLVARKVWNMKL